MTGHDELTAVRMRRLDMKPVSMRTPHGRMVRPLCYVLTPQYRFGTVMGLDYKDNTPREPQPSTLRNN